MTHAGYVYGGYLVTLGAVATFAAVMFRRIRRSSRQIEASDVPWRTNSPRPLRLSQIDRDGGGAP